MILLGCAVAVIVTVVSIRLLSPVAPRLNLIDYPGGRKQHTTVKPLIGGIALFMGFASAMLSLPISLIGYRPFAAAGFLLIFMGILDDMHELSARARLGAEIIASLLMAVWAGISLNNLGPVMGHVDLTLGWFAVPFTVFAVVGLINAVNMLDGSDGLAGTLTLTQLFLFALAAVQAHFFVEARIILLLMSALLGFLVFNFPFSSKKPAPVFMGDAGSMFLGFALGWFAIYLSQPPHQALYPVSVLWILGLTLWDAVRVILFRLLEGRSPLKPDRNHLHHVLQDAGYSPLIICLLMGGANLVLGGVGLVANQMQLSATLLFGLYLVSFMLFCFLMREGKKRCCV